MWNYLTSKNYNPNGSFALFPKGSFASTKFVLLVSVSEIK